MSTEFSNQLVSEMFVTLMDLQVPMSASLLVAFGK